MWCCFVSRVCVVALTVLFVMLVMCECACYVCVVCGMFGVLSSLFCCCDHYALVCVVLCVGVFGVFDM